MKASQRRELRHDQFVDTVLTYWERFYSWATPRKTVLLVALSAVLLLLVAYVVNLAYRESRSTAARQAIYEEEKKAEDNKGEPDYARLAREFRGTPQEPYILYKLALQEVNKANRIVSREQQKKLWRDAIENLRRLLGIAPKHQFATDALLLMAQQYMNLEEWREAERVYRHILSAEEDLDPRARSEAKFWLAYSLERMGRKEEAQSILEEVAKEQTPYGDDARYYLGRMRAAGIFTRSMRSQAN